MRTGDLLNKVEERFFKGLEQQTNWGRNQVKLLYTESVNQVLREFVNKVEQQDHDNRIPVKQEDNSLNKPLDNGVPWED